MFDNKIVKVPALGNEEIHISRIIASWTHVGGQITTRRWAKTPFANWCVGLGLDTDVIREMVYFATNGKLELEDSAKKFLEANK